VSFFSLLILSACGGGGSSTTSAAAPVFSTQAPTAASQGAPYTYTPALTDPAGGTVTVALTAAPTGAALSASTISWTPTALQSRVPNRFTLTASTSEGGSATQSWTVSPSGTITLNYTDTYWTENGPTQQKETNFAVPNALVPQADGSFLTLNGVYVSPGVAQILNVPAGYFWLTADWFNSFWTSSSTVDLGQDYIGANTSRSTQATSFTFSISGVSPGQIFLDTGVPYCQFSDYVLPGSTTYSANITIEPVNGSLAGWSPVHTIYFHQFAPASLGSASPLTDYVLGSSLTLSNLTLIDGATNNISGTLQPSPQTSLNIDILGSQWAAAFNNVAPTPVTLQASNLEAFAEPNVVGRSAYFLASTFPLVSPIPGYDLASVEPSYDRVVGLPQPAISTDTDFGTLQYGDPYPAPWTRAVNFYQVAYASYGGDYPAYYYLLNGETLPLSSHLAPLAPLATPVRNPTINGASLYTEATLNTTTVSLSWSAPTGGSTPYGYSVVAGQVLTVDTGGGQGPAVYPIASFLTDKTSATLPPLPEGYYYIFYITTLVDGAANVESSPYRRALPSAYAQVVSAPIVLISALNSGAQKPVTHANAKARRPRWQQRPLRP
jgi:hypothetical protein